MLYRRHRKRSRYGRSSQVTATGQLGVLGASSARFKDQIKPMNKASEAILALKPVTFRYEQEIKIDWPDPGSKRT